MRTRTRIRQFPRERPSGLNNKAKEHWKLSVLGEGDHLGTLRVLMTPLGVASGHHSCFTGELMQVSVHQKWEPIILGDEKRRKKIITQIQCTCWNPCDVKLKRSDSLNSIQLRHIQLSCHPMQCPVLCNVYLCAAQVTTSISCNAYVHAIHRSQAFSKCKPQFR